MRTAPERPLLQHNVLAIVSVASAISLSAVSVGLSTAAPPAQPCEPAEVASLVVRFIDALNAGNIQRLDRLVAREPDFRWYSTDAPGRRLLPIASNRASLMQYYARRHARGEHLKLTSLRVNGNTVASPKPYGNFEYRLVRSAHDLPPTDYQGKGALHCYGAAPDALIVWSMARASAR